MGQHMLNPRSQAPPGMSSRTCPPRSEGFAVNTERPMAARRLAPCCVPSLFVATDGSPYIIAYRTSSDGSHRKEEVGSRRSHALNKDSNSGNGGEPLKKMLMSLAEQEAERRGLDPVRQLALLNLHRRVAEKG